MAKQYKKWKLSDTLKDAHKKYNENLDILDENSKELTKAVEKLIEEQNKLYSFDINCWDKDPKFWYPYIISLPEEVSSKNNIITVYCCTNPDSSRPSKVNSEFDASLYNPEGVRIFGKLEILINEFKTISGMVTSYYHRDNRIPLTFYYNLYQKQIVIWCLGGLKYSFMCSLPVVAPVLSTAFAKRKFWGGWVSKNYYFSEISDEIIEMEDNPNSYGILPSIVKTSDNTKSLMWYTKDSNDVIESYIDGKTSYSILYKMRGIYYIGNPINSRVIPIELDDPDPSLSLGEIIVYVVYDDTTKPPSSGKFGIYTILNKAPKKYENFPISYIEFIGILYRTSESSHSYNMGSKVFDKFYSERYVMYENKMYVLVAYSGVTNDITYSHLEVGGACLEYNYDLKTLSSIQNFSDSVKDHTKYLHIGHITPEKTLCFEGNKVVYSNPNTRPT